MYAHCDKLYSVLLIESKELHYYVKVDSEGYVRRGGFAMFYISDDKKKIAPESVMRLIRQTYWASNRPLDEITVSIENSVCFGAYDSDNDELIGFARVVTDFSTCYYLCDVIVDEGHRSNGIGKALVKAITSDERFDRLEGLLITRDAHGLYSQYGFTGKDGIFMGRGLNSSL